MRLTLERLSKQFKNRIAVDDVNAELREGIYGFLGANGAGKNDSHADDLRDRRSDKRRGKSRRKK